MSSASDIIFQHNEFRNKNAPANYDTVSNTNVDPQNFKRKRSIDDTLYDERNHKSSAAILSNSSSGSSSGNTSIELNSSFCESNLSCGISSDTHSELLASQQILESLAEPFSSLRASLLSDDGNEFGIIRNQKSKATTLATNNSDSKLQANKRAYRERLNNIEQSPVKTYQNDHFMGDIELFNLSPLGNRFIEDNIMQKPISFLSEFQEGVGALEWESLRRHQQSAPTNPSNNNKLAEDFSQQKVDNERKNNNISNNQSYQNAPAHVSPEIIPQKYHQEMPNTNTTTSYAPESTTFRSNNSHPNNYSYDANRVNVIESSQPKMGGSSAEYSSSPRAHSHTAATSTTTTSTHGNTSHMPPPRSVHHQGPVLQQSYQQPLPPLPPPPTYPQAHQQHHPHSQPLTYQSQPQQQPPLQLQLPPSQYSHQPLYGSALAPANPPHNNHMSQNESFSSHQTPPLTSYSNNNNNNNNNCAEITTNTISPPSDNSRNSSPIINSLSQLAIQGAPQLPCASPATATASTMSSSTLASNSSSSSYTSSQLPPPNNNNNNNNNNIIFRKTDSPTNQMSLYASSDRVPNSNSSADNYYQHSQYHQYQQQQHQHQGSNSNQPSIQPQSVMTSQTLTPMSTFFTNSLSLSSSSSLPATPTTSIYHQSSPQLSLPPPQLSHPAATNPPQHPHPQAPEPAALQSPSYQSFPNNHKQDNRISHHNPPPAAPAPAQAQAPSTSSLYNSQIPVRSRSSSSSSSPNNTSVSVPQQSYDYRYPPNNNHQPPPQQQQQQQQPPPPVQDYNHPPYYHHPPPPPTSQHHYESHPYSAPSYPPYHTAPPPPSYAYYPPHPSAPSTNQPPPHSFQYPHYNQSQGQNQCREISPTPQNYPPSSLPPPPSHFSPDPRHPEPHPSPYPYYQHPYPSSHPDNNTLSRPPSSSSSESASRYAAYPYPPSMDYSRSSSSTEPSSFPPQPQPYAHPFHHAYPYFPPYGPIPPLPHLQLHHPDIPFPASQISSTYPGSKPKESGAGNEDKSPPTSATSDKKKKKVNSGGSANNGHPKLSISNSSDTRIGILPSVGQFKKELFRDSDSSSRNDKNNNSSNSYRSSSGDSEDDEEDCGTVLHNNNNSKSNNSGNSNKRFTEDEETKYASNEALFESLQNSIGAHCNCRKSRCLKLYCDCFRSKRYCDGCYCRDCQNKHGYDSTRDKSMRSILDKNPYAFVPRLQEKNETVAVTRHVTGCNCKRSSCLKKYCECFQAEVMCSERCRCVTCKNKSDGPFGENEEEEEEDIKTPLPLKPVKAQLEPDATAMITAMLLRQLSTIKPQENEERGRDSGSGETTGSAQCSDPLLSFAGVCMQRATQERMDLDSSSRDSASESLATDNKTDDIEKRGEGESDMDVVERGAEIVERGAEIVERGAETDAGLSPTSKQRAKELLLAFFWKSSESDGSSSNNVDNSSNKNNTTTSNNNNNNTEKTDTSTDTSKILPLT